MEGDPLADVLTLASARCVRIPSGLKGSQVDGLALFTQAKSTPFRVRTAMVGGAEFPDHERTDHAGKRRRLSELQGADPMILVLSRVGYCAKDLRPGRGSGPSVSRDGHGSREIYDEMSRHGDSRRLA